MVNQQIKALDKSKKSPSKEKPATEDRLLDQNQINEITNILNEMDKELSKVSGQDDQPDNTIKEVAETPVADGENLRCATAFDENLFICGMNLDAAACEELGCCLIDF